jgi:hypothetical protein
MNVHVQFVIYSYYKKSRYDQNEVMCLKDLSTKTTTYDWKRDRTARSIQPQIYLNTRYVKLITNIFIQGVIESCTDILTTSYWLHVEHGRNI